MKFNVMLDEKRRNEGYSLKGLAREAGVSVAGLSRIINNNDTNPHPRTIVKLCKVLKCEPGDIGFGEE